MPKQQTDATCSFCGKNSSDVVHLVGGTQGFVCNECVETVVTILGSLDPDWLEQHKKFIAETDWAEVRKQIAPEK